MIGEGLCRERAARRAPRRSRGWAAGGRPTQREALWPCGRFSPGTGWTRGSVAESVLAELSDPQNKILAISHCNCPERAEAVKEQLVKHATFKDVIVVDMAGISSMYANDGGIIVVV